jgi:hypothetical protein
MRYLFRRLLASKSQWKLYRFPARRVNFFYLLRVIVLRNVVPGFPGDPRGLSISSPSPRGQEIGTGMGSLVAPMYIYGKNPQALSSTLNPGHFAYEYFIRNARNACQASAHRRLHEMPHTWNINFNGKFSRVPVRYSQNCRGITCAVSCGDNSSSCLVAFVLTHL